MSLLGDCFSFFCGKDGVWVVRGSSTRERERERMLQNKTR